MECDFIAKFKTSNNRTHIDEMTLQYSYYTTIMLNGAFSLQLFKRVSNFIASHRSKTVRSLFEYALQRMYSNRLGLNHQSDWVTKDGSIYRENLWSMCSEK